jgi:acyl transferase domain-containing protein
MQKASEAVPSGLMTVFLGRDSKLNSAMLGGRKWCSEQLKLAEPIECQIANYLNAQCRVIGGNKEALDFIEKNYQEFSIRRVKRLPLSGAFHTPLMYPAESQLKAIINSTSMEKPIIRFYSNFDAITHSNVRKIKYNLIKQISYPVKWEQILNEFYYDRNLPFEMQPQPKLKKAADEEAVAKKEHMQAREQTPDRLYPDIYECGPAGQTGPILREINRRAYTFYHHVEV